MAMKRKLLFLSFVLFIGLSGVAYAAATWNGFTIIKIFSDGDEFKATDPAILVKNKVFVPVTTLQEMGINITYIGKTVVHNPPRPRIKLDQVSDIMDSVFEVYGYKQTETNQGSGFTINNILITNFHVAGNADSIDVVINGEKVRKTSADVVFQDEKLDIIGIRLEGQKSLKYTTTFPVWPETVYTMGFPQGKFRITEGMVLKVYKKDGQLTILHNALSDYGLSGGLLFNAAGEAVGVTTRMTDDKKFGEAIPIGYIETELIK
jgi:S1-C subfamily serine protease